MDTRIFTLLDEERKIMSFSISEIAFTLALVVIGFVFHALIIAIGSMFCGVFIMRYVKEKLKKKTKIKKIFKLLK